MPKLTKYIEQSTGYNSAIITSVMAAFYKFIEVSLRQGEEIKIENFGNFFAKDMEERPGRNPRTGEPITIAAKRKAVFKFSKSFLNLIQPGSEGDDNAATPIESRSLSTPAPAPVAPPSGTLGVLAFDSAPTPSPTLSPPSEIPIIPAPPPRTLGVAESTTVPAIAMNIPPIPETLVKPPADKVWYLSSNDDSPSYIEVRQSELQDKGVEANTPLWSERTGWILAKNIKELEYLFAAAVNN